MSEALGIHDHPTRKLGARPNDPTKPRLQFADHLKVVPDHPIVDTPPNLPWPMDGNDQWGDCVVAGSDHALQAIYTLLKGSYTNWTIDQIIAYYKTQNPDFDPKTGAGDNGMVIQDFLSYLVKQGVILGFAAVPLTENMLKAAVYLGVAIITGEELRVAQQTQKVWSYVSTSPDWGGHCSVQVGYKGSPSDNETCVTWGALQDMTQSFIKNQISEAWFIVTQAHIDNPTFRAGFDLESFATAYKNITGRDFPAPAPPPAPTPTPTPPPPSPTPTPPSPHTHPSWWDDFLVWVEKFFTG